MAKPSKPSWKSKLVANRGKTQTSWKSGLKANRAKPKVGSNPLKTDPTRTVTLRRTFVTELLRRFARLKGKIVKLVSHHDSMGLQQPPPGVMTANTRWSQLPDADKVTEFQDWLAEQFDEEGITGLSGEELWSRYVSEGFKRGQGRAFDDVNRRAAASAVGDRDKTMFYQGNRDQFLKTAFGQPVATDKVKLLAGRAFDELEGMTGDMGLRMSRTLTDGLVRGASPHEIARGLVDEIDISRVRAERIAQHEITRSHNEGQLMALEQLGVEEVGVMVEWLATPDDKVCEQCAAMEGVVLTIEEAKGMLPSHVGCRCTWTPANVGESKEGQTRGKDDIEAAMDEAYDEDQQEGLPDVSEERPESIFDQGDEGEGDEEGV